MAEIAATPHAYAVEETRRAHDVRDQRRHDEILGATLLSIDAQEIISTVAIAMRHGITAAAVCDAIYTHPSSTEAFDEALVTIVRADEPQVTRT